MSYKMTEKEMIDNLLSANNQLREQLKSKDKDLLEIKNALVIAVGGLKAIKEYGDSQEIAKKTIIHIEDIQN